MNVAIIDDERHCIESLELHLKELYPHINIIYQTQKPQKALQDIPKIQNKLDLLFLDIQMQGLNGFQLLEHLSEPPFDIIFTTAFSQYAIQAFQTQAINYLLKPINEEELKTAVDKWKNKTKQSNEVDQLLSYLKKEGLLESKIAVPVSDGYDFIEIMDIMYCKSKSNYVKIYLSNNEEILIAKTLKELTQSLKKFFFIRVQQSYLVNPNYIKKYKRKGSGFLIMKDHKKIIVSKSKRKLIIDFFETISED